MEYLQPSDGDRPSAGCQVRLKTNTSALTKTIFQVKMKPMTRHELQTARDTARIEKERASIREQELVGELWAEQIYKRVKETAELGHPQYQCHWPSTFTAVAYTQAVLKLREWFPDSNVDTVVHGALSGGETSTSVRIRWGHQNDIVSEELLQRRLEKETEW
jgi:hypothetical protein